MEKSIKNSENVHLKNVAVKNKKNIYLSMNVCVGFTVESCKRLVCSVFPINHIAFNQIITEAVLCPSGSDGRGCPESFEADFEDVQDAKSSQGDLLRDSWESSLKHIYFVI